MTLEEKIKVFDQLLLTSNPDAGKRLLVLARNNFLRRYASYDVDPEIELAIATDEELLRLRHAGKKCQEVYANARMVARDIFVDQFEDIMELKEAIYNVTDLADYSAIGIDRMVLQCVERGARSKQLFDILMPIMIADRSFCWHGDVQALEKSWSSITKQQHPNVKDPHTYIVRYYDHDGEYHERSVHVGVDPSCGKKSLVDSLTKDGYAVNVSGRINGLPIHFINAEKREEAKRD